MSFILFSFFQFITFHIKLYILIYSFVVKKNSAWMWIWKFNLSSKSISSSWFPCNTTTQIVSVQNSSLAAIALLQCVERGGPQQQTAISLLAERFDLFSPFLADKMSLLHKLFYSSLPALQLGSLGIQQQQELRKTVDPISIESLAALASVANNDSNLFVRFVTESLYNPQHSSFAQLNAVISSINPVIQRHPTCLIPHLVVLCSSLLKMLILISHKFVMLVFKVRQFF